MEQLWPTYWGPRVWAIVALIIGLGLEFLIVPPGQELLVTLKHDVEVALIVFALLTFTFEGQSRRHLTQAAEKAASQAVAEVRSASIEKFITAVVGERAFRAISPFTTHRTFTRPRLDMHVHLRPLPANADYVLIDLDLLFRVSNVTSETGVYTFGAEEDVEYAAIAPDVSKILRLAWNDVELPFTPTYSERSMTAQVEVRVEPQTTGKARASWRFIRSLEEHYDLNMAYLTEEAYIHVEHPPEFSVSAGYLGFVAGEHYAKETDMDEVSSWHLDTALLPSQGITVKWEQRRRA